MKTPHTPTPWKVVSGAIETVNGTPIAIMDRETGNGTVPVERDENAAFIVKAVNCHEVFVWTIRALIGAIEGDRSIVNTIIEAKAILAQSEGTHE